MLICIMNYFAIFDSNYRKIFFAGLRPAPRQGSHPGPIESLFAVRADTLTLDPA